MTTLRLKITVQEFLGFVEADKTGDALGIYVGA